MCSTSSTKPLTKKKELSNQARNVAYRIVNKCLTEQKSGVSNIDRPWVRAATYTGMPINSLYNVHNKIDTVYNKKFNVDDFDRHTVHRFVEEYFLSRLNSSIPGEENGNFYQLFKQKFTFSWELPTLRKLLKEMGYYKRQVGSKLVRYGLERLELVNARKTYVEQIRKFRQSGRNIFYIDETWFDDKRFKKYWRTEAEDAIMTDVDAKDRLILIHAGSKNGFLDEAKWLFEIGVKQDELQVQMGHENFELWITKLLIPNLPPNSVVVMDSASYHNELNQTLSEKKTEDEMLTTNTELADSRYKIDTIFKTHGHFVLRIPPFMNPEFNPVLLAWEMIAQYIIDDIETAKNHDVHINSSILKLITQKAVSKVTVENWREFDSKVQDMENIYWLRDRKMEEAIDKIGEECEIFYDNIPSSDSESE